MKLKRDYFCKNVWNFLQHQWLFTMNNEHLMNSCINLADRKSHYLFSLVNKTCVKFTNCRWGQIYLSRQQMIITPLSGERIFFDENCLAKCKIWLRDENSHEPIVILYKYIYLFSSNTVRISLDIFFFQEERKKSLKIYASTFFEFKSLGFFFICWVLHKLNSLSFKKGPWIFS